jgi:hypothetical protein
MEEVESLNHISCERKNDAVLPTEPKIDRVWRVTAGRSTCTAALTKMKSDVRLQTEEQEETDQSMDQ